MDIKIISNDPRLHLVIALDEEERYKYFDTKENVARFLNALVLDLIANHDFSMVRYRGVPQGCFETILKTGIDVTPTSATVYLTDDPGKALEYGWDGSRVLLLAYDQKGISRTYAEVPSETPEAQVQEMMATYATREVSVDGKRIWLSRLSADDPRRTTPYEATYGGWFPGDPKDSLVAVFYIGEFGEEDVETLRNRIEE